MSDREPRSERVTTGERVPESDRAPGSEPGSEPAPESEARPGSSKVRPASASRPGFVTMPADLRAFYQAGGAGLKLSDMPGAVAAAEKLREAGRGPDVLFDNLREQAPRDPSANDNRAEHAIVELPASASPWANDAAAAKQAAEGTLDKSALPSAASAKPAASVTPAASVKPRNGKRDRRWPVAFVALSLSLAAIAVVLVWAQEDPSDPVSSTPTGAAVPTGSPPAMTASEAATGAATTGAATTTGTAMMPTARVPTATTATTASTGAFTGTRPVPKGSGDPYVDAGALPKTAADPAPSVAPVVTAVPSTGPTSNPSATRTNPWDVVFEKKKESASQ